MQVRIAAITAVVDLLMKHGLAAFITGSTTPDPEGECDTSETASRVDSNIESALDSDMAMRVTLLSPNWRRRVATPSLPSSPRSLTSLI